LEWNDSYGDIVYLLWCALNNKTPQKNMLHEKEQKNLLDLCISHKMIIAADHAVSMADDSVISPDIKIEFKKAAMRALRINVLFEQDKENVVNVLEENNIRYVLLKGCIIKDYYKYPCQREMGDIDILIPMSEAENVRDIMEKSGYKCEKFGINHHDEYFKKPFFEYEMHRTLFSDDHKQWKIYYENVEDRLIKCSKDGYEYKFSKEDFYIYFFLHGLKHFKSCGIGIRFLADIYLYLKIENLNEEYIYKEFEKLGVLSEEKNFRKLAFHIFDEEKFCGYDDLGIEEKEMLLKIMYAGAYGNKEIKTLSMINSYYDSKGKKSKFGYMMQRIFCITPKYKRNYPKLYKFVLTRPVIVFIRIFDLLTKRRKVLKIELDVLKKTK